jgi:murein L,D-transpeptidase YcbB/YkuD
MLGEGTKMRGRAYILAAVAATMTAAASAEAKKKSQPAPAAVAAPQVALPASPNGLNVRYFYERRNYAPIWFRAGAGDEAVGLLLSVLRRAPIDGMANGPQVAASVEAAVAAARSGDALKQKEAELVLSAAWVDYVSTLQRPNSNVIWGDPSLVLKPSHPDRILALLSASPSAAMHLQSVSSVNTIYARLRDVAVAEAATNGGRASDAVMLNMERARIIPGTGKFILVNSAEQRLHMYENGQSVDSMKVVVGDKDKLGLPTPIIASTMHYAIANPYWHVPPHLIRSAVAPNAARQGEAYLKAKGYEIISDFSKNPTILPSSSVNWKAVAAGTEKVNMRQKPNGENSMGKMKFPFPNREGIFLHDTPRREHFAKSNRAISNGCIRVEDYRKLAYWVFGRDVAAVGSAPEQHLSLPRGVPVYVTYLTMVPDAAGMTRFADRYGWDRPGVMAGGMDATLGVGSGSRDAVAGGAGAAQR